MRFFSRCSGRVTCGAERRRTSAIAFVAALVLVTAGTVSFAQSPPTGSLAGKLTDLHSRPMEGTTLVLRNAATGAEARTTTSKNGSYRFSGLAAGEYTLEAGNPELGRGQVQGIFVSAGHEARVQAALELDHETPEPLVPASRVRSFTNPGPLAADVSLRVAAASVPALPKTWVDMPSNDSSTFEARLSLEPIETLPLRTKGLPEIVQRESAPMASLAAPPTEARRRPEDPQPPANRGGSAQRGCRPGHSPAVRRWNPCVSLFTYGPSQRSL